MPKVRLDCVLVNSGTLRADDVFPRGAFKMRDLVTLLPMLDEMCIISLTGSELVEALENGVCMYPKLEGRFPCVSGIRFAFDPDLAAGSRVIPGSVSVQGEALELDKRYNLATKAYLAQGRDGYAVLNQAQVVMDGETLPMLADLLRIHLANIGYINSILVTLPDGTQVLRPEAAVPSPSFRPLSTPALTPPRAPLNPPHAPWCAYTHKHTHTNTHNHTHTHTHREREREREREGLHTLLHTSLVALASLTAKHSVSTT